MRFNAREVQPEGPSADFELAATLQHPERDRFWPGADRAYIATVLRRRKRGAQQKKCEEKERGAYKASVLDRRKR